MGLAIMVAWRTPFIFCPPTLQQRFEGWAEVKKISRRLIVPSSPEIERLSWSISPLLPKPIESNELRIMSRSCLAAIETSPESGL